MLVIIQFIRSKNDPLGDPCQALDELLLTEGLNSGLTGPPLPPYTLQEYSMVHVNNQEASEQ